MRNTGRVWSKSSRIRRLLKGGVLSAIGVLILVGFSGAAQVGTAQIQINPPDPTTEDHITIKLSGTWPDSCVPSSPVVSIVGRLITIATSHPSPFCFMVLTDWSLTVPIGRLPANVYWVVVTYIRPGILAKVIGRATFTVTAVIAPICDPGPPVEGQFVVPASRYYATGGPDPQHDFKGADIAAPITIPNARPTWGPTYAVTLAHTGDWLVYHIPARGAPLERIDLCLRNLVTPRVGTPVEVYVTVGEALPPAHDSDLATLGWTLAGTITIAPPGDWKIYSLNVTLPGSPSYTVGIRLKEGEIGPDPGKDRNVEVAWVKIFD